MMIDRRLNNYDDNMIYIIILYGIQLLLLCMQS